MGCKTHFLVDVYNGRKFLNMEIFSNFLQNSVRATSDAVHPQMAIILVAIFLCLLVLMVAITFIWMARKGYDSTLEDYKNKLEDKENKLEIIHQNLQSALSVKSDFLATISHEIRTPVNGIVGMNQLLLEADLNEEERNYAETANRCAHKLIETVEAMIEYSDIKSGSVLVEETTFDLNGVLTDLIRMAKRAATIKQIKLSYDLNKRVPEKLIGDPQLIKKIIQNLINNSLKFTESGGFVALRVKLLSSDERSHAVRIELQDSGIGISNDVRHKILTPFTQADGSSTRKFEGLGLGLSISQKISKAIGGELDFISTEGKGTLFSLKLKLKRAGSE